jgi:Bardet-Biedl syndrome 5 protein
MSRFVWEDREIRFDVNPSLLKPRKGEQVIDSINSVEDTKGNNGARGSFIVTDLRIIWVCHGDSRVNLSVGHKTILSANIRKAKSKLRGSTQALCIVAKFNQRYEFVFTSLVKNSPRLFTTVQAVMRAYETSSMYRELKLRGSILKDGEVMLLPLEKVFNKFSGVWNLSSDQGNLGTMYLTNVRIVWHANLAANFNVSLPYMQIKNIVLRNSKFGKALVIETLQRAGGFILGFRVDPLERLGPIEREISALLKTYGTAPVFGVEFSFEEDAPDISKTVVARIEEDVEVVDDSEDHHAMSAYYAEEEEEEEALEEGGDEEDEEKRAERRRERALSRVPVLDLRLGLAVESPAGNANTESLWRIL